MASLVASGQPVTTADGGVLEKDDRLRVEALDARIDAEAPYHPRGSSHRRGVAEVIRCLAC